MKRRTKHLRACRRKKKYNSWQAAQTRACSLWPDIKLRPYRCPVCGGWHLTRLKQGTATMMAFKTIEQMRA